MNNNIITNEIISKNNITTKLLETNEIETSDIKTNTINISKGYLENVDEISDIQKYSLVNKKWVET